MVGALGRTDLLGDPNARLRQRTRTAMITLGALVVSVGGAATLIPMGGAVIASGEVSVESRIKPITHATGGIVSAINVHDGDHVKAGDVLMGFDTTVAGPSAELSGKTVDQLLAQKARLEAEQAGLSSVAMPPELAGRTTPSARTAMAQEIRLFSLNRQKNAGLRAQLADRIRQSEQEIVSYQRQISALRQQMVLIQPEREGVRKLWEKKLVTINRLNELERTAVQLEGSDAALQAQIAQSRAQISEIREQMVNLDQTMRADAATTLAQVNGQLNDQRIRNVSATDTFDRSVIRAPQAGVVDKLAVATIGGVVKPADVIMVIVPDSDTLTIEAKISPSDIDQLKLGQAARIRFTAFSVTETPEVAGRLVFLSADRTTDERSGASYYRARLEINRAALAKETTMRLVSGMPAEVFISTGSRSMMSFLTKPLSDQFARAFRQD